MSIGTVNCELERSDVGMGIRKISQWVKYSDFTKSTQYGILTMTKTLPAGCFYIGCKVTVKTVFNGGTNNLKVGKTSGEDEFCNGENIDVGTTGSKGAEGEDILEYLASATTAYLRIDEGSDWDDVTAGQMLVELFYLSTVLELSSYNPNKYRPE